LIFDPLFRAHRSEQAQVIALDCKSAASRLKITDWAMLVQDERRRFVGEAGRRDFLGDLSSFWEVVGDVDGLCAVAFAVNDFPFAESSVPVACAIANAPKQTRTSSDWSVFSQGEKRSGTLG
jgi:hypothetical protein